MFEKESIATEYHTNANPHLLTYDKGFGIPALKCV